MIIKEEAVTDEEIEIKTSKKHSWYNWLEPRMPKVRVCRACKFVDIGGKLPSCTVPLKEDEK